MPVARVRGIDLNYRLEGDGPETVVLVNGLADDLETWVLQVPALLEAGLRVLRFDNRGIGASDAPPGPYTTREFADDTKALVDELGIDRFHLLGVSMGGMIAQEYALAYPDDLESLVLACTYSAPGPFCSRMFALWADMAEARDVPFVMRDVTLWAFTLPFFEQREDELREFEGEMAAMPQSREAYLAQLHSIREHDTSSRLHEVAARTLVVAGEEDILIPVALSRRLQKGIPGAAWATVPGGHACIWEHPDPFNQVVVDFIRGAGGGS